MLNEESVKGLQKSFLNECKKKGLKLEKVEHPEASDVKSYIFKKYINKETIDLTIYFSAKRNGRSDEEIEKCLRELKVNLILTLASSGFKNAMDVLNVKMKYKVED